MFVKDVVSFTMWKLLLGKVIVQKSVSIPYVLYREIVLYEIRSIKGNGILHNLDLDVPLDPLLLEHAKDN